jgi:hypothetical protein
VEAGVTVADRVTDWPDVGVKVDADRSVEVGVMTVSVTTPEVESANVALPE